MKAAQTAQLHIHKTTQLHILPLWTLAKRIGVWPKQHMQYRQYNTTESSSIGRQCKYVRYATRDSANI